MDTNDNISFKKLTTNKHADQVRSAIEAAILELSKKGCPHDVIARELLDYGFLVAEPKDEHDPVEATTWMAIIDGVYDRTNRLRQSFDAAFADDSEH